VLLNFTEMPFTWNINIKPKIPLWFFRRLLPMELSRTTDEIKPRTASWRLFETSDEYFSDWRNQGAFHSCCKDLPKLKYVFHEQISVTSIMPLTLKTLYSASFICLDSIPCYFLDWHICESLTTSELSSTELLWMFTYYFNWTKVPNFCTNDADLPITLVNKQFVQWGKSLFLTYFWALNSNISPEFPYPPHLSRCIRLCENTSFHMWVTGGL